MAGAVSPADARAYILERLVGDTGEPDKVVEAGRKLGKRAVAELGERLNQHLSFPLEFDLERIEISRMAETLVDSGENHAVAVAASTLFCSMSLPACSMPDCATCRLRRSSSRRLWNRRA